MNPIIISASILSANWANLAEQIHQIEAGGIDWIHVDVMDGAFVPNITMGPFIVETFKQISNLPIDVHLMIEKPERHIEAFARAGASRLGIHIEGNPNVHRTLQEIRSLGCSPTIVLNPGTPAWAVKSVLDLVDMVLIMTVNPGFAGQKFLPQTMAKVDEISQMLKESNSKAIIQVDGGITKDTLPLAYNAGARCFVSATSIFKHADGIVAGIQALRNAVDSTN